MEQNRRVFAFCEEESSMEEEWMRDRALLRDLLNTDPQTPPRELARALGRKVALGQKMAQAVAGRRSPRSRPLLLSFTSASCALLPASTCASKPASWRCVSLHQSIWDARQVPEPCSLICRAIQSCKPQGFACLGPAERSGSCFGKQVVFCPSHRGNSGELRLGSRWRRFKWMRKDVRSVSA